MKINELKKIVQAQMPVHRWQHTVGVINSAIVLAKRFHADPQQAHLAALLHDYAKYWPAEKQKQVILNANLPTELLQYGEALWHAPVAAWIAETELGITDSDVLNAIRYHTSGREEMSKLEKIVCLADYIEPGRNYPAVVQIRQLAETSLEQALVAALDSTLQFLILKKQPIYPLTVRARNYLINEVEEKE